MGGLAPFYGAKTALAGWSRALCAHGSLCGSAMLQRAGAFRDVRNFLVGPTNLNNSASGCNSVTGSLMVCSPAFASLCSGAHYVPPRDRIRSLHSSAYVTKMCRCAQVVADQNCCPVRHDVASVPEANQVAECPGEQAPTAASMGQGEVCGGERSHCGALQKPSTARIASQCPAPEVQ